MFTLKRRASIAVFGLALGLVSFASADEVHFTGSTLGSLNGGAFLASSTVAGLSYTNSTFDNDTVAGFLNLGGNPNPGTNFNNLGSFTLSDTSQNYNGIAFAIQVTFSAPFVIAGGSTAVFTGLMSGAVSNGNGGVFFDFDNTGQTFTFSNGSASGSFTMFVNDLSLSPGQTGSITGRISATQAPVPEPATLAALGVGAFGLLRRRRLSRRA